MSEPDWSGGVLKSVRVPAAELSEEYIAGMWDLYRRYYGGTDEGLFRSDLAGKTDVVLMRDGCGNLRGFSTIEVSPEQAAGRPVLVIFSGDTIVDHRYWGRNDFAFTWIRFLAEARRRYPGLPLYWLLIVKGHRTYRYLSVFSRRYYPAPDWPTPPETQALIDELAARRFGAAYERESGLLRFPESRGHLEGDWAAVPDAARRKREVAYFLERNPGYGRGDELVCLCEVREENMQPLTLRLYRQGRRAADPVHG
ncbi:MAG TPA: hypothetical protein VMN36_15760 [Verrucomicrobiales bacterium]|nr:hypothetical protein [Verrucomicrobiales bacterium]